MRNVSSLSDTYSGTVRGGNAPLSCLPTAVKQEEEGEGAHLIQSSSSNCHGGTEIFIVEELLAAYSRWACASSWWFYDREKQEKRVSLHSVCFKTAFPVSVFFLTARVWCEELTYALSLHSDDVVAW